MKTVISVLTAHFFVLGTFIWLASPACADSGGDYKAGSDFAKQVQGNGLNSLKNFSGEQNLPGYTANPDQTKYYGGVTASGDSSLKSDSALEFSQGDTGKTITESFTNRPPDQISQDAPFIQAARDTESRADSIVGDTGQSCTAQVVNRSEFTNHTCERDLQVENFCTREATLKDNHISYSIQKEIHHKTGAGLPAKCPSPPLKSAAAPGRRPGNTIAFNDGCCNYSSSSL